MIKCLSAVYFALISLVISFAQEKDEMQELLDKALLININAKIVANNGNATWSFKVSRVTIPGQPIPVKLTGMNINVSIVLTPYREENSQQVLLVAQVQVWLQEEPNGQGKYLTSLKQIPVTLGQNIQFFPLGVEGIGSSNNIQLDIEILRYKDLIKKEESPPPKKDSSRHHSGETGSLS